MLFLLFTQVINSKTPGKKKKKKKQNVKQWTRAILSHSHSYIDENGQKIKFLSKLFKPNNVATSMNADRKENFLTIFAGLIM